jgi:hypothetical protein
MNSVLKIKHLFHQIILSKHPILEVQNIGFKKRLQIRMFMKMITAEEGEATVGRFTYRQN